MDSPAIGGIPKLMEQAILAVVTAFTTALFLHILELRRIRNKQILDAISSFRAKSHSVRQLVSNRMQNQVFSNYYDEIYKLTKSKEIFEQNKIEINNMPELSLRVSDAYAELYDSLSVIEQLIPQRVLDETGLKDAINDFYMHHSVAIIPPTNIKNVKDAEKYKANAIKEMNSFIQSEIDSRTQLIYRKLLEHARYT